MRKLALALIAALLLPVCASAWDRSYHPAANDKVKFNKVTSIELFSWKSDLDGVVNVENGTDIDLDRDVGLNSENRLGLRISHVLNEKSAIELSYLKHDHSGVINKNITFANKTYRPNASMRLQNSWIDLAWSYNLTSSRLVEKEGREAFYLDGMFGVKFSSTEINVTGSENSIAGARVEKAWSESFPVPYVGLAAGGQLAERLWLKGNFKVIKVNAGGYDALHSDYSMNAAFRLNPHVTDYEWFVDLGYRGVKYNFEGQGDKAEIKYTGPTLGIFSRF